MEEDHAFLSTTQPPPHGEASETRSQPDGLSRAPSLSGPEDNHELSSDRPKAAWSGASTQLHWSMYVLFVVLIYASLATVSWLVICVLTYKPINGNSYAFNNRGGFLSPNGYLYNEEVFGGMRVIQAVVSTLIIPITLAACSCVVVVYVQHNEHSLGMSMRKTMVLLDGGWTSPTTLVRLVSSIDGYKRIGSLFVLLATALNIVGGLLRPLQQIFISTTNVKTPGGPSQELYSLLDIADQFRSADEGENDDQLSMLMTRDAITTTTSTEPFTQLWHEKNVDCDSIYTEVDVMLTCRYGASLSHSSWENGPFLAELPSTFNSSLIRQFAPRSNSSASYAPVDGDTYPPDCANAKGSFFARYQSNLIDTDNP